ncbi:hypothetical protein GLYMA_15G030600v4 [Glycine max]|uniref:Uncharacterized protein n=1 Tax=Glycine max TaxID=3847 RepID=A0A0R0G5D2_SOYBN|nr:hypothetical protein JHK86_041304 [Glycine max]KAH1145290.1 hypothetical protein GYH30_041183 [Glycine max]KRH10149.1 hypothetical protein GLYMA_15G030600v4 [Glycine max]
MLVVSLGRIHVCAKTRTCFSSKFHLLKLHTFTPASASVSQLGVSESDKKTKKSSQLQHVPETEFEDHKVTLSLSSELFLPQQFQFSITISESLIGPIYQNTFTS